MLDLGARHTAGEGEEQTNSLNLEVSSQHPQRLQLLSRPIRLRLDLGFQVGLQLGGRELEGGELGFE